VAGAAELANLLACASGAGMEWTNRKMPGQLFNRLIAARLLLTDTEKDGDVLRPFAQLIGREFIEFLFEKAPRKVVSRIVKSMDHHVKAQMLGGIDDEMGVIRCIAADSSLRSSNGSSSTRIDCRGIATSSASTRTIA
jgi:hypothetical protein